MIFDSVTQPSLSLPIEQYASSMLNAAMNNLPMVLIGAGILAGVVIVLQLARKFFGMSDKSYALQRGPVERTRYGLIYRGRGDRLYTESDFDRESD